MARKRTKGRPRSKVIEAAIAEAKALTGDLPHSIRQIERKMKARGDIANYELHFAILVELDYRIDATSFGPKIGRDLRRIVVDYCCHVKRERAYAVGAAVELFVSSWTPQFSLPGIIQILRRGTYWHAKDWIFHTIVHQIDDCDLHEYLPLLPALKATYRRADSSRSWKIEHAIRRLEENLPRTFNYFADAD